MMFSWLRLAQQAKKKNNMVGFWGNYHELGHNFQKGWWTFESMTEVSNNWFTLYLEENYPDSTFEGMFGNRNFEPGSSIYNMVTNFKKNPTFDQWQKDPFLALYMFLELRMAFGWQSYREFIKGYLNLTKTELPISNSEKRDQFMLRFSNLVGRNIAPLFDNYTVPLSDYVWLMTQNYTTWDPNTIIDCSAVFSAKAPCAQLLLNKPIVNTVSTYSIKINNWAPLRKTKGEKYVFTFVGDAPVHPNGLKSDPNFGLKVDSDSSAYISTTANWVTVGNSTSLEIDILKFISSEQVITFNFNLLNAPKIEKGFVGLSIKIVNSKGVIKHFIERTLEKPVNLTLKTLKFIE